MTAPAAEPVRPASCVITADRWLDDLTSVFFPLTAEQVRVVMERLDGPCRDEWAMFDCDGDWATYHPRRPDGCYLALLIDAPVPEGGCRTGLEVRVYDAAEGDDRLDGTRDGRAGELNLTTRLTVARAARRALGLA